MFQALKQLLPAKFTWVLPHLEEKTDAFTACSKQFFKSHQQHIDSTTLISHSLGYGGQTHGFAATRANAEGLQAQRAYWWCLDPLTLVADMRTVVATDSPLDLGRGELSQIQTAISECLPPGLRCVCSEYKQIYLCVDEPWSAKTVPTSAVIGSSIDPHLPSGKDAQMMIRYMHEWQMVLHSLPFNLERQSQGLVPVSGLWLWGGGELPTIEQTPWDMVVTNDYFVYELALLAGLPAIRVEGDLVNLDLSKFKKGSVLVIDPYWMMPKELTDAQRKRLTQATVINTTKHSYRRRGLW